MAFDVGIGELVGSLFFGGGEALAADAGLGAAAGAADLGLGAADLGLAAGAGAAAGTAADLGGLAAGTAADIGAAGGAAADLTAAGTGAAAGGGDVLSALETAVPEAVDIAGAENLGSTVGGVQDALNFAPTPADTGVATTGTGAQALPGTTAGAPPGATAASGVVSPSTELATGPENLNAALGTTPTTPPTEATTAQVATSGSPMSEVAASANSPFVGQLNAEGGLAPDVSSALATAPATPAAPAAPAAESPSLLSKAAGIASNPLVQLGVPAAMLGYNLIKGSAPIPPQAQEAVNNAKAQLAPLQNAATQNVPLFNKTAADDLNLANSFQISPAQAAAIATWKQDQLNALRQQIANQNPGSPNIESSSEWIQGKNQIDQQALAMQVQMVNQLISTAFQASSAANAAVSTSANVSAQFDSTLMQAAQLQVQQDTNFQNAVGASLQAFGLIAGLNANRFGKAAGTATA
jgi:hypothetical protein